MLKPHGHAGSLKSCPSAPRHLHCIIEILVREGQVHLFRRADLKLLVPPVGTSVCGSASQVFIACQLCLYPAALKV